MPTTTMTSLDRVLATLHYEPTDRVPFDYAANGIIDQKLKSHFGLKSDDYIGLLRALNVDMLQVAPPYIGPRLHAERPDMQVDPQWGIHTRWVENESGGYTDFCHFPLSDLNPDALAAWPMPNPDHFDYAALAEHCKQYEHEFALYIGNPGLADIINQTGMLVGMDNTLAGIFTGDEALLSFIDCRLAVQLEVTARALEAAQGRIRLFFMGEDLGTQRGPMISLRHYRQFLQPRHRRFFDLAKSHNLPIMVHTCGSSSWVYEDFIADGVTAVDTLQPEAANMSPRYLKDPFGDRLAFHGCISTAGPLAYGSVEDVRRNVRETLEIMMPGGGYFLSPTHMIQDNSPLENVLAMYETGLEVGRY